MFKLSRDYKIKIALLYLTDVNIGKILHTTPDWQIQLNDNDYAHFHMALFQKYTAANCKELIFIINRSFK
jgi:hypothetical protein